ncbi:MAG: polysaccharide biosynthesis protein [Flavobacteriaceae bacterium]|nr:polysaccharide biosynthesis protein [Flavobacteriaceae bacterium]
MLRSIFLKGAKVTVARWVVLLIDVSLVLQTFFLAYLIYFNFNLTFQKFGFFSQVILVAILAALSFLMVGSHRGTVRHTGMRDVLNVILGVTIIFIALIAITWLDRANNFTVRFAVPYSVASIHFMLNIIVLVASRFIFKRIIFKILNEYKAPANTLIYGAGESGLITYATISNSLNSKNQIVGFIDDDKSKVGKKYNRLKVYPTAAIDAEFLESRNIREIIVSIQNIKPYRLIQIVDHLFSLPVKVKVVPPVEKWINGTLNIGQITEVKIEDLLNRNPIKINNPILQKELNEKTILITGAAGSIGSEIALQIGNYKYKHLVLLDQAESGLYDIQQEFFRKGYSNFSIEVADIRNADRVNHLFKAYSFDMIFHAAAYKHVPMMEENPYEAVRVNIYGTRVLMDCAVANKVDKFVMVSTDKAVNPTNVMGASKRIAEMYANCLNRESETKFITTRFGNVLGSNGSVIPLFKKQIAEGGPIQVTHKKITRYFMTISEACSLVLEAGVMGNGGEIYVFDMGESVRIYDLAKKMIHLSGLRYPEDIDIKIVGLRPGEKLYEELLSKKENTIPTYNEKIMIAKVHDFDHKAVKQKIIELSQLNDMDGFDIVTKMKGIVPEFISNNSQYETLDKPAPTGLAS